jgi:hypothetical protein
MSDFTDRLEARIKECCDAWHEPEPLTPDPEDRSDGEPKTACDLCHFGPWFLDQLQLMTMHHEGQKRLAEQRAKELNVLRGQVERYSECNCEAGQCDDCRLGDDGHIMSLRRHCLRADNESTSKPAMIRLTVRELRAVLDRIEGEAR